MQGARPGAEDVSVRPLLLVLLVFALCACPTALAREPVARGEWSRVTESGARAVAASVRFDRTLNTCGERLLRRELDRFATCVRPKWLPLRNSLAGYSGSLNAAARLQPLRSTCRARLLTLRDGLHAVRGGIGRLVVVAGTNNLADTLAALQVVADLPDTNRADVRMRSACKP